MILEEAIFALLYNDEDLQALVGDRIYPQVAKQSDVYPYIVYEVNGEESIKDQQGHIGISNAQVQVDCHHDDYLKAKALSRVVLAVADDFAGIVQVDDEQMNIQDLTAESSDQDIEPIAGTSDGSRAVSLLFNVWYEDAVAAA